MAPRRQAKHPAESVAEDANGDLTPPKRKKMIKPMEEPKQPKQPKQTAPRREKKKQEEATEGAGILSKARGGKTKSAMAPTVVISLKTSSRLSGRKRPASRKMKEEKQEATTGNGDVGEQQTAAKKARGTKTSATKKAGASPVARKQRNAEENGAGDASGKKRSMSIGPAKRTRARTTDKASGAVNAPTSRPVVAKTPKKRKNTGDVEEEPTVVKQATTGVETAAVRRVKKSPRRPRARKATIVDKPEANPKGRAKKNNAKMEITKSSSEEVKTEKLDDHNVITEKNNSKTRTMKNAKKENSKKTAIIRKRNTKKVNDKVENQAENAKSSLEEVTTEEQVDGDAVMEENDSKTKTMKNTKKENGKKTVIARKRIVGKTNDKMEDTVQDATMPEANVKKNGTVEQIIEQQTAPDTKQKRNVGKTNATEKEKAEVKDKQEKEQMTASIPVDNEEKTKEGNNAKDDTIENVNSALEMPDENEEKDLSLNKSNYTTEEEKKEEEKEEKEEKENGIVINPISNHSVTFFKYLNKEN